VKFREKLPQFHNASSTSRLRPNEDVLAIKEKFAREFWLASGRETSKSIARPKLEQVDFWKALLILKYSRNFVFLIFFLTFLPLHFQLIEEEKHGKDMAPPESSFEDEDEDEEATDTDGEGSGDSSSSGSNAEETSEHEENSPKVDITN
jgi:hypothetical protein